jgi:signal transduction histidine kinase
MELELEPVKIKHVLESSLVMIKEKAFNHGIQLVTEITSVLEDFEIMADERKLKQITFNLLSNAAKFTPDGGQITIECKKEGEQLVVSVTDTGVGIAPEEKEKVFEEFYQTRDGSKSKTPGTGLGLPLTRSFVEMHGGKIWAESEGKDKGSRFIFTIPIR